MSDPPEIILAQKQPRKAKKEKRVTLTKTGKIRKQKARKAKDAPRRPLSAYNLFFREQRRLILEEQKEWEGKDSNEIDLFASMGKTIAKRWKELEPKESARFQLLALEEKKKYQKAMDVYNAKAALERIQATDAESIQSDDCPEESSMGEGDGEEEDLDAKPAARAKPPEERQREESTGGSHASHHQMQEPSHQTLRPFDGEARLSMNVAGLPTHLPTNPTHPGAQMGGERRPSLGLSPYDVLRLHSATGSVPDVANPQPMYLFENNNSGFGQQQTNVSNEMLPHPSMERRLQQLIAAQGLHQAYGGRISNVAQQPRPMQTVDLLLQESLRQERLREERLLEEQILDRWLLEEQLRRERLREERLASMIQDEQLAHMRHRLEAARLAQLPSSLSGYMPGARASLTAPSPLQNTMNSPYQFTFRSLEAAAAPQALDSNMSSLEQLLAERARWRQQQQQQQQGGQNDDTSGTDFPDFNRRNTM